MEFCGKLYFYSFFNHLNSINNYAIFYAGGLLNTINGIRTTGSCSGHNERCLFVDLIFENYEAIIFLIQILYSYFRNEFILLTHPTLECDDKIIMRLSTTDKGKTAYINANKLCKIIKEFL